jgi:hypothetical protein
VAPLVGHGAHRAPYPLSGGACAIARKAGKIAFYASQLKKSGIGMRLRPGPLHGPSAALVALPSNGPMAEVLAVCAFSV